MECYNTKSAFSHTDVYILSICFFFYSSCNLQSISIHNEVNDSSDVYNVNIMITLWKAKKSKQILPVFL